ncbi:hypothetical protein GCM10011371_34720 [Novosphingobium marinum]|uniref:AcrR family transcriptional regulator n=1 Tax=Novosphingobium marinum TaxID=1514948 RepID=A0A7Z0BUJ9_9SPHN|nr:TetR/AcrR family transcriptional regulator [Novosphingobium marinum]NYH97176.1 AcrR family transcriptional regulator [Novosphingobium marinum]GGC44339.1 hypothetical protein GCM10011371_34720 [Novosphingobium marinum]
MKSKPSKKTTHNARRTQDERSEEMRARLLTSSIKMLKVHSYSGFRVADVADDAGVSRGAQVHHFASKDKLVTASLELVFSRALDRTMEAIAKLSSQDKMLEHAFADAEKFFYSDEFFVALDIVISGYKNGGIADEVRQIAGQYRLAAENAWIARLVKTGLDPDDAEDILWVMWSVIRGLAVRRQIGPKSSHPQRVTELVLKLLSNYADTLRRQRYG